MPPAVDDRAHLVHGDYHIDNAIFDDTPKVIALLDWELSTLGDPIADTIGSMPWRALTGVLQAKP